MSEQDYVLGTEADEIERLGIQHDVWRERVREAWARAGIGAGQTVLDVGAGPGWASADLAELVGPEGRVIALERSPSFAAALRSRGRPTSRCASRTWPRAISARPSPMPHGAAGSSPSSPRPSGRSATSRGR